MTAKKVKTTEELVELLSRLRAEQKIQSLRMKVIHDKIENATKDLKQVCEHAEISRESYHFEGSYTDRAYTEYWNKCKCCGTESERTTTMHSWYG